MTDPIITTHLEAAAAIRRRIYDGTLARHQWTGTDAHGRHVACLLAAASPDVAAAQSAGACPAWLLPPWLAHLTPWIDDSPSDDAWPSIVRRYAELLGQSSILDATAWRRLDYGARRIAVLEARSHVADGDSVLIAIDRVVALLDREIAGSPPSQTEWDAAYAAARAARAASDAASDDIGAGAADRICAALLDAWAAEIATAGGRP